MVKYKMGFVFSGIALSSLIVLWGNTNNYKVNHRIDIIDIIFRDIV